jgi:hypothetical protein
MSGSSFLSVGDALLEAGVARNDIHFLCSRQADLNALCARDAAARWSNYRFSAAAPASRLPREARLYIGGGYWRHELIGPETAVWPASWSQMERMKFLSPDRQWLFKFIGFGRFGRDIYDRTMALSEAGYAAALGEAGEGFGCYRFVEGAILSAAAVDRPMLERMAAYCAFRRAVFGSHEDSDSESMQTMLRFNVGQEFGVELNGSLESLETLCPVLVDGRMLPHEWVRARDGRLLKCDGATHGDDHFFPGPATDICWDLAGVIVEWGLAQDAADYFLRCYERASGDNPRPRLPAFLLAYSVFRLAYCKMAATAMSGSDEEPRLIAAYRYYRQYADTFLAQRESLPVCA